MENLRWQSFDILGNYHEWCSFRNNLENFDIFPRSRIWLAPFSSCVCCVCYALQYLIECPGIYTVLMFTAISIWIIVYALAMYHKSVWWNNLSVCFILSKYISWNNDNRYLPENTHHSLQDTFNDTYQSKRLSSETSTMHIKVRMRQCSVNAGGCQHNKRIPMLDCSWCV